METLLPEPRFLRYTRRPEARSPNVLWAILMSQAARFSQNRAATGEDTAFLCPEDATDEPEC